MFWRSLLPVHAEPHQTVNSQNSPPPCCSFSNKNDCTVRVAVWDVKLGKGIDDLLLREGHHPGRFVPAKTAGEAFEKSFDLALKKFGLGRNSPVSKITEEERKGIVNEFTKQMKRFFGI